MADIQYRKYLVTCMRLYVPWSRETSKVLPVVYREYTPKITGKYAVLSTRGKYIRNTWPAEWKHSYHNSVLEIFAIKIHVQNADNFAKITAHHLCCKQIFAHQFFYLLGNRNHYNARFSIQSVLSMLWINSQFIHHQKITCSLKIFVICRVKYAH